MNTLFSDYDGTIKTFNNTSNFIEKGILNINIKYINDFIKDGNNFVLTTGRSTESILYEINRYNINYNYLTSYDGRIIYDNKGNLVNSTYINKDILNELKSILKGDLNNNKTIFNEKGISNDLENVVLLVIKVNNYRKIKPLLDELKKEYQDLSINYSVLTNSLIISTYCNKSIGASKLLEIDSNIRNSKIYSVGDSFNDLELLKDYNGYKMLLSYPILYKNIKNTTLSVASLIKKIKKSHN